MLVAAAAALLACGLTHKKGRPPATVTLKELRRLYANRDAGAARQEQQRTPQVQDPFRDWPPESPYMLAVPSRRRSDERAAAAAPPARRNSDAAAAAAAPVRARRNSEAAAAAAAAPVRARRNSEAAAAAAAAPVRARRNSDEFALAAAAAAASAVRSRRNSDERPAAAAAPPARRNSDEYAAAAAPGRARRHSDERPAAPPTGERPLAAPKPSTFSPPPLQSRGFVGPKTLTDAAKRHCAAADLQDSPKFQQMSKTAAALRQRILLGWSEADLQEAPRRFAELMRTRCRRMHDPSLEHSKLIFTHIPKTGGQSMQAAIGANQRRARIRDIVAGHVRYGDVRYNQPRYFDPPGQTDLMTVFRDPAALLISNYHFMRRNTGHGSHKRMLQLSLREHLGLDFDDGTADGLALFSQDTRQNKSVEQLRGLCTATRKRDLAFRCLCTDLWTVFFVKTLSLLAEEYAVVGVLERLQESLEVARCRIPWMQEMSTIPKHNARPAHSAQEDAHDETVMTRKTFLIRIVYDAVNMILTEDLKCCRARLANTTSRQ